MTDFDSIRAKYGKIGNLLCVNFINHQETGYDPFNPKTFLTEDHYESDKLFKELNFEEWKEVANKVSAVARKLIPKEKQNLNYHSSNQDNNQNKTSTIRLRNSSTKSIKSAQIKRYPNPVSFQTSQVGSAPILDNVFWVDYEPHGSSIIFLHFDLDGEILDVDCHKFEFSDCRTIITRLSKVPAILQNVPVVFKSIEQAGRNTEDSYQVLMQNETKKGRRQVQLYWMALRSEPRSYCHIL